MPKLLIPTVLGGLLAAPLAAQHDGFQAAVARFEAKLAGDVAKDGVGAISAAVIVGDRLRWAKGFGWADVAARIPATHQTIYRTGSISKSITAVAMARLLDQGKAKLDDKVVSHLPEFGKLGDGDARAAEITLRQLASHTGGLIREPRLRGAAAGPIGGWEGKVLASIPRTACQADPGQSYAYSNIGYGILGLAVSRAGRTPFMQLVNSEVFRPLGMQHSAFVISGDAKTRLAAGYANRRMWSIDAEFPAKEHAGRGYKVPNGGVYATVGDLCRFAAGVYGAGPADFLSAATRAQVLRRQTPGDGRGGYGLGFSIRTRDDGSTTCGHGGSVAGYNAHLVFDPRAKIGVSILRNYNRGATDLGRATTGLLDELVLLAKDGQAKKR